MNTRAITLLFLLLYSVTLPLQARTKFVRVFNLNGHLIARGDLITTTDTSVIVQDRKTQVEIPVSQIGFIKTARTFGGPIGIGAAAGFLIGTIIGAAAGGSDSRTTALNELDESLSIATGMALGTAGGAVIGTIISATKKRLRITINGDVNTWQQKRQLLNTVLPANG